jgi:hypothetical protein
MFLGSRARPVRTTDNLTAIADCLDNVGFSTFHNPIGLHGLLTGIALLLTYHFKSPDISVGTATGYGWWARIRFTIRAINISLLHSVEATVSTAGSFREVREAGASR